VRNTEENITRLVQIAADAKQDVACRHQSFGRLIAQFQDMAFVVAFGFLQEVGEAEDAVQEAFLAAWQNLPQLREPAAFPAWLCCLVRTRCLRRTRRKTFTLVPLESFATSLTGPPIEDVFSQRETTRELHAAMAQLSEMERDVLLLFHIAQYTRDEIAVFLGISPVVVKKRLASARHKLRERLLIMLREELHEARPSNDTAFQERVLAFTKLFSALIDEGQSLTYSLN
jgi:RNA polymerase sigma factor (sigma-70 family)